MLGTIGAVVNPDVHADTEHDIALEAGPEARPTQPPYPSLIVDVPSGCPEDLGTPDTVNVEDILSVDVTPLMSISISGMDVTSYPDMSVAKSMSIDPSACYIVAESSAHREIQDPSTSSFVDDTTVGAHSLRNPSTVCSPNLVQSYFSMTQLS